MDESKIRAIVEWEPPTKVTELRSFLGLVNYYRHFISGYSSRTAPLTDLLKKNKPWVWSEACQFAFEDLKAVVNEEPVLALPNFEKMFKLHTDASNFAIGGVLMQERHPIAFESRKLNETERRYTVQEKEMTAIVHCLRIWRHYLLGSRFVLAAISLAKGNVHEKIKEGLEHDLMAKELMRLAKEGKTRQFWVEDGLLYTKGRRDCTAEEAARAFFKNVVKYWGLPKSIISDRDPRFTGRLWTELLKLLGSELCFSTSFHPQTDGQTERVNALLECYLRHFVSANQHDWAKIFDVAQVSYNLQRSEATGKSPFELATGQQPLIPHTLAISFDSARCPGAAKMAKSWAEQSNLAKSFLEKARRKMKKWADPKRRHLEFNVGDKVLIKLIPQQFKAFRGMHKGLVRKYEGPYPVVAKVGKVSYRLDLPSTLKIHPVFHVSMLRPYQEDEEDPNRGESHRAPPVVTKSFDKEIEEVLSHKVVRHRGVKPTTHYFIKWKGLPESDATWESQDELWQFQDRRPIDQFPNGPRILGLPVDSKLDCVIREGELHWLHTRHPEFKRITYHLPQINQGRVDNIVWKITKTVKILNHKLRVKLRDPKEMKHWSSLSGEVALGILVLLVLPLDEEERNKRIFNNTSTTPKIVAYRALDLLKDRLHTLSIWESLASIALKCLWRIAW
ncbi:hypothetical protein BUALT_Bualt07G0135900 [Buddleja alternifolia]|uniref:Uncharacterized protein n=1 Tax=Buddleja alternifolia TaxID=168488 RepID=A0AAV6X9W7_9LAMI|nr:hypothetical protein BUALT_Bualt07G0135900 [Buddleja alternifolia]